jgi:hypothetical protein
VPSLSILLHLSNHAKSKKRNRTVGLSRGSACKIMLCFAFAKEKAPRRVGYHR